MARDEKSRKLLLTGLYFKTKLNAVLEVGEKSRIVPTVPSRFINRPRILCLKLRSSVHVTKNCFETGLYAPAGQMFRLCPTATGILGPINLSRDGSDAMQKTSMNKRNNTIRQKFFI
jgi:hypothetical protein